MLHSFVLTTDDNHARPQKVWRFHLLALQFIYSGMHGQVFWTGIAAALSNRPGNISHQSRNISCALYVVEPTAQAISHMTISFIIWVPIPKYLLKVLYCSLDISNVVLSMRLAGFQKQKVLLLVFQYWLSDAVLWLYRIQSLNFYFSLLSS